MTSTKRMVNLALSFVFISSCSSIVFEQNIKAHSNNLKTHEERKSQCNPLCKPKKSANSQYNNPTYYNGFPRTIAKPLLGHVKSTFVDAYGRVVILHGMNIMNKIDPWYLEEFYCSNDRGGILGDDWVQFWAANGLNVARVGIAWAGVEPVPGIYNDAYIEKIRQLVRLFAKYGIFTILDFHQDQWAPSYGGNMFPEWAANNYDPLTGLPVPNVCVTQGLDSPDCEFPDGYFNNPGLQQIYDNFWYNIPSFIVSDTVGVQTRFHAMISHAVTFFKDEPYLMMYQPANELLMDKQYVNCVLTDHDPNTPCFSLDCGADFAFGVFADYIQTTTATIRMQDKKHMILYGLNGLEVGTYLPIITPSMDQNLAIGQVAYGLNPNDFPSLYQFEIFQPLCNQVNKGLFVEEVGANLNTDLSYAFGILDQNMASWTYWVFLAGNSITG